MLLNQDPSAGLKPFLLPDQVAQRANDEISFECDSDMDDSEGYDRVELEGSEEEQAAVVKGACAT